MTVYDLEGEGPACPADDEYWVAPTATVIGKVSLAPGSSVWYGAVLRGDNDTISLGRNSNLQDNSVCHTDMGFPLTIGEDCTIGHLAMLHGCTIGNGTLIGIGATILNGAVIGENCIIGAHALIAEGKTIPPRSLVVGAPGRVLRAITDEQVEGLIASARNYVIQSKRHRNGLQPVS